MRETREQIENGLEIISAKYNGQYFCWRCGNRGFWFEQVDGPENLRKVYCDNSIHLEANDGQ